MRVTSSDRVIAYPEVWEKQRQMLRCPQHDCPFGFDWASDRQSGHLGLVRTPHLSRWISSEWTLRKAYKLRNQRMERSEGFVLVCATTVRFMEFLQIWEIVESVTYAPSMRPIVGAPGPSHLGTRECVPSHPWRRGTLAINTSRTGRVAHITILRCGRRFTSTSGLSLSPTSGSEVTKVRKSGAGPPLMCGLSRSVHSCMGRGPTRK